MEYTTQSLSKLAKVSPRTLRYYDQIGLLKPIRKSSNGYRIYGQNEVDKLQQILFYKAMGMELETIKQMLENSDFDAVKAMETHLEALKRQQQELSSLIEYVDNTIMYMKGEKQMSDKEKFEIYKDEMIKSNEEKYGTEAREKYGDAAVDFSNMQIKGATKEQLDHVQDLSQQINEMLKIAVENGNPECEAAQKACALHQEWIKFFWKSYSPQAHLGLCQMYLADERFYAYYEKVAPKAADFLYEAMKIYLEK